MKKSAKKNKGTQSNREGVQSPQAKSLPQFNRDEPDQEPIEKHNEDGDVVDLMPNPESILLSAQSEPDYRDLSHYRESIVTLRRKGFSFRDIAEWLSKRNIAADHNAVYRVFVKKMTLEDAETEADLEKEGDEEQLS